MHITDLELYACVCVCMEREVKNGLYAILVSYIFFCSLLFVCVCSKYPTLHTHIYISVYMYVRAYVYVYWCVCAKRHMFPLDSFGMNNVLL